MDNIGGYILLDHDKLLSKIQSADPLNPSVITESEFDEIYSKLLSGKEIQIRRPDGSISPVGSYQTDVLLDVAQSATLEFNVSYGDGGVENYQYNLAKIIDETDPDAPVVSCFGIVAVRLTTVPLPDMTDAGKMLGVDDDGNYAFVSGGGGAVFVDQFHTDEIDPGVISYWIYRTDVDAAIANGASMAKVTDQSGNLQFLPIARYQGNSFWLYGIKFAGTPGTSPTLLKAVASSTTFTFSDI